MLIMTALRKSYQLCYTYTVWNSVPNLDLKSFSLSDSLQTLAQNVCV